MTQPPVETTPAPRGRRPWGPLITVLAVMIAAGLIAAYGIADRGHAMTELARETHEQAVSTVSVTTPPRITLPLAAPVVLGQYGGRLAGPVRDGALADLATQNRKLSDSNREAGCAHQSPSCQIRAGHPGSGALSRPMDS